jgi:hypothetical protein
MELYVDIGVKPCLPPMPAFLPRSSTVRPFFLAAMFRFSSAMLAIRGSLSPPLACCTLILLGVSTAAAAVRRAPSVAVLPRSHVQSGELNLRRPHRDQHLGLKHWAPAQHSTPQDATNAFPRPPRAR